MHLIVSNILLVSTHKNDRMVIDWQDNQEGRYKQDVEVSPAEVVSYDFLFRDLEKLDWLTGIVGGLNK